ncbi:MAG: hypothetical protein GC134_03770 [Proteobacteria bacterium]|nr:hypothetical protein [Pseudomonadota bacterium]
MLIKMFYHVETACEEFPKFRDGDYLITMYLTPKDWAVRWLNCQSQTRQMVGQAMEWREYKNGHPGWGYGMVMAWWLGDIWAAHVDGDKK